MNLQISQAYSGPNITVSIEFFPLNGGLTFTVKEVDLKQDGDIRGVFFHLTCAYTKVTGVTGLRVTDRDRGNNTVINLGDGATMQGNGGKHIFDVGVEIAGTSGTGKYDDIRETTFTVMGITYSDIDLQHAPLAAWWLALRYVGEWIFFQLRT